MSKLAGYISSSIHIGKGGRPVINYSQWRSVKDIEAMRQHLDVGPYMKRMSDRGRLLMRFAVNVPGCART
jgi:hypothetical protein